MRELLEARARKLGLSVAYVSAISTRGRVQEGAMGGWDGRRSEVQVLARLSSSEKVFVLAHELTHAEMAIGYEEEAKTAGVKRVEDMEAVVHCACESWLRAMGVEGYWEFCCANGRTYLRREDLEVLYPLLASLSEAVSQGIGFELGMDGNSSLEA